MVGSRTEKGTRRLIREKADCKLWFEVHWLFIYFIYLFIYLFITIYGQRPKDHIICKGVLNPI